MCRRNSIECFDPRADERSLLSRRRLLHGGLLLGVSLAAGCQSTTRDDNARVTPVPSSAITNTDPCATRLHDICGAILFYYATRHRLPARLEELTELPGFEDVREFRCPASNQPYLYNAVGIVSPDQPARVILYDPAPSHAKMRWAVSIAEPQDAAPLVTKVIALPESYFSLNLRVPK